MARYRKVRRPFLSSLSFNRTHLMNIYKMHFAFRPAMRAQPSLAVYAPPPHHHAVVGLTWLEEELFEI
jgi:hypothetical protein